MKELTLFKSIGQIVSQRPWIVLLAWVIIVLAIIPWSRRVNEVFSNNTGGLLLNTEERFVKQVIRENFASERKRQLFLTVTATNLNDESWSERLSQASEQFEAVLNSLQKVEGITSISYFGNSSNFPSFSKELHSSLALIQLNTENLAKAFEITKQIQEILPKEGLLAYYLTGVPAIELAFLETAKQDTKRAELYGLPLSLVILVIAFGALVAASLPILVALMSISISFATLFLLGQFLDISAFVQTVVTMLGLATGIDYALLMVNRFREELLQGSSPKEAAISTTATAGKAVALSGLTVVAALTALLIPPLAFIRSVGLSCMVVIFFSVVISLTALPALFCLLGKRINLVNISKSTLGQHSRRFWYTRAKQVLKKPFLWVFLGFIILLGLSYPALSIEAGFSGVRGLTEDTNVNKAQLVLEDLDLDGLIRSFDIVIDFGEQGFFHPLSVRTVTELSREIKNLDKVITLYSPTQTGRLPPLLRQQYYATQELALQSPLRNIVKATVGENGQYALLQVFPEAGILPTESRRLAAELRNILKEANLNVFLGGDYAFEHDWVNVLYQSFPYALLAVYIITFILLGLAFHSLLIPLKSIILNTFTVSAAFGVVVLIFQNGWFAPYFGLSEGLGFIEASIPIFIFAIVFGLSMDYEVFLVARIFENHKKGLSDKEAVIQAVSATGGVISGAALIMLLVFAVFIFSHLVLIKTLALGLSVAVLLDATLVRLALVPAVMLLAGKWNWWLPSSLKKITRGIDLSHD